MGIVTRHSADGKRFCGSPTKQSIERSNWIRTDDWMHGDCLVFRALRLGLVVSLSGCGAGVNS